ncbi:hypothetical protein HD806DRAFT_446443 [Xylariaceae sp. AK1471]|nr:hypothetical protein HD806DRAFT_446443 [Xylariaceae sp. AK1471]
MQRCRLYLTPGGCHFGDSCKFPHLDPNSQINTQVNVQSPALPNQQNNGAASKKTLDKSTTSNGGEQRFYQWRRIIPRQPADPNASFGQRLGQFFQIGLTLVEGDLGVLQETVKLLASEGGLLSIRELIECRIPLCRSDAARIELWRQCVRPLFAMLTEKKVTHSTLLEMSTGAIYNAILGYNASRLQPLYDFLFSIADKWHKPIISDKDGQKSEFLEFCTAILARVVDCNTQALVNDTIPPIVERFKALLDNVKSDISDFWVLQAGKNIEYIRKRLSVVRGVAQPLAATAHSLTRASFLLRRDLPGELSAEGPRHDNDHADCTKIRILPTMSEIMATRQDYRPFYDPSQWHLSGVQGLIDRHFRLLRDDMVGQLKESISYELDLLNGPQDQSTGKRGVRTHSYDIFDIVDVTCNKRHGVEFHLQIAQPFHPDPRSTTTREEYWAMSRRLEAGALVCVLQKATAIFCVVSESTLRPDPNRPKAKKKNEEGGQTSTRRDLFSHEDFSYVKLCLAEAQAVDVEVMIRAFKSGLSSQRVLVEFPGILLPSFQSTLVALQQIYETADLPFSELLAPDEDGPEYMTISPPLYSTKRGFTFNLKSITNEGADLLYSPQDHLDPELLSRKSQLDYGQAVACLNALRRSFQVIQGPPGTGKSWTGEAILKVLLDNKNNAQIGPILCVCYTNHALDQLLEHLWHRGITQIIRIGSRSKSTLLEDVNLRKVAKDIERTKAEKQAGGRYWNKLNKVETEVKSCLDRLKIATSGKAIKAYLIECDESSFYSAIFGAEAEEGWTLVTHKDEDESLNTWIRGGAITRAMPRPVNELRNQNPGQLSRQEREALCHVWVEELMAEHIGEFVSLEADHRHAKSDFEAVQREIDLRVLSECQVIGLTTTGLAKNLKLLRKVDSKVLLCEEAGEVLESHILTALLPSLEHVILIGDHLQLRPQVANYELSVNNPLGEQYSLDVSLFERLVKPIHPTQSTLPFDTLTVQRRMHPSISRLIRETIYSDLEDAAHLLDYPEVVGMRKRLFWLDHNSPESKADPTQPLTTSHTNDFEVDMVAALVSHLVRQGVYSQDQIAVLTPYLGQLYRLRKRLGSSFEIVLGDRDIEDLDKQGIELDVASPPTIQKKALGKCLTLATIDNFQGEEAAIVVISLVRSNPEGRCGFLKTSNRINVLLSRAKHGMYLLGNSATYAHVPMWSDVIGMLKEDGNFGTKLPLQCPRHKEKAIEIGSLDDFVRLSPEAGCDVQCLQRLSCGHTCTSRCHSMVLHKAVRCLEPCPRSKSFCDHPCPNFCGDPCEEKCSTILKGQKLELPCGHFLTSPRCWQIREPESIKCTALAEKTVPGCGHKVHALCYEDTSKNLFKCMATCDFPLPCGHLCSQSCERCRIRVDGKVTVEFHPPCTAPCGRAYSTCTHSCSKPCHPGEECQPCDKPCEIQCNHSRCGKTCSEPCTPCAVETCCSACPHSQCTMPCAAPCNWTPCSNRCAQTLACGHQCPSLCGEICPEVEYCQICAPEEIKSMVVDMIEMREYREIDLGVEPCIFPDCMHVLTITSMDGQLGMSDHYDIADNGQIKGIKEPADSTQIKSCPTCRGSLRNLSRYGRLVRQALLDESTKKFIAWSHNQVVKFETRLLDEQERLDDPKIGKEILATIGRQGQLHIIGQRIRQLLAIDEWVGYGRYSSVLKLYLEIAGFVHHVAIEEQPYQRVHDLVQHARRRGTGTGQFSLNASKIQNSGLLLAGSLLLRCDLLILTDFVNLRCRANEHLTTIIIDLEAALSDCKELVRLAKKKKYVRHEAEGHIYFVQFVALARQLYREKQTRTSEESNDMDQLMEQGYGHMQKASVLLALYKGSTSHLVKEFEAAKLMLNDSVFYAPISVEEKRAVWLAMSRELLGTGHWYTCQNGHPFTIGECGMPMEETSCPECGAPVGGQHHDIAEGVQHDEDMDALGAATEDLLI